MVPVHDDLDGEDLLAPDNLEGIHHVLVDGVALEGQSLSVHSDRHLVVGLDGLVGGDSGKEGLPSAGPAREVVGLDTGDDDEPVGIDGDLVDLHGGAVLGGSKVHALRGFGVVDDNSVAECLQVPAEDVAVLLLGGSAVGAGGDKVPGCVKIHPALECVEDSCGGGGPGSVVDDEDDILTSLQECLQGFVSEGVVERFVDDLVCRFAHDILGIIRSDIVLLGNVYPLVSILTVSDVHDHLYQRVIPPHRL